MATLSFLGKTKDSFKIYYDSTSSHAATHFADVPELKGLVVQLVGTLETKGEEVAGHFDMGHPVGVMDVVTVDRADEIVYAIRQNREEDGLVPFTKSRKGTPCSYIAIHLVPQADRTYILQSAWVGTFGGDDEPFPMAEDATPRSAEFWNTHAFTWGSQSIKSASVTTMRPW